MANDTMVLIGRYRLIEVIGSGGMGDVWRAHDDVLDRPVAVKIAAEAAGPGDSGRLRAEAQAYGRIASRHIAQVYDYGETDAGMPFIVMEFVDGVPLSQRTEGLPWRQAVTIAAELADALRATHACGLVHRDVKPDNVILTADGAKLVDFGISANVGSADSDAEGEVLGTPGYVAPERLADVPVAAAADVYALGVLLYRLLCGRLPWPNRSTTEALRNSMFEDPDPLEPIAGLPAAVERACLACLEKDPGDRPTSATLATMLNEAIGREPAQTAVTAAAVTADRPPIVDATRASALATPTRWLTTPISAVAAASIRRPVIVAVACITLGMLVLVGTWAANGLGGSPSGRLSDQAGACLGRFDVTRDTGSALDADLTLTNLGPDLNSWHASLALAGGPSALRSAGGPDAEIGDAATIVLVGNTMTVRGGRGAALSANRDLVVPVRLAYTGQRPDPRDLALNGTACQLTVSRPHVAPTKGNPNAGEDGDHDGGGGDQRKHGGKGPG